MLNYHLNKKPESKKKNPLYKVFVTFFFLFLFRLGNSIPLANIDQNALENSINSLNNNNGISQLFALYSSGDSQIITPFSLGIVPFINASLLVDLLTTVFPKFEKLQTEEGQSGKQSLFLYKKVATLFFSLLQSIYLLFSIKEYIYNVENWSFFLIALQLITGSMMILWLTTLIDKQGIGNGTSLILFSNIVLPFLTKNQNFFQNVNSFAIQFLILGFFTFLICLSQTAKLNIEVVSARQLAFLETKLEIVNPFLQNDKKNKNKQKGLAIKFNQAGIFPIIIASNLIGFFTPFTSIGGPFFSSFCYGLFLLIFNYFYTLLFWDPEKISEQLRKASVSLVNISPGKETVSYLENVVKSTSLLGGLFLCLILLIYNFLKALIPTIAFPQLMISSLIIVVGVAYEFQKSFRSFTQVFKQDLSI